MFNGLARRTLRAPGIELTVDHSIMKDEYRGWQIEVTTRRVGVTVRRNELTLALRHEWLSFEEKRRGFSSLRAALDAAHRRVDFLMDIAGIERARGRQIRWDDAPARNR